MALLSSAYLGPDIPQLSVNAGPVILQEIWVALRFHDICGIKTRIYDNEMKCCYDVWDLGAQIRARHVKPAALTISRHRCALGGLLSQHLGGCFQLLLQPADVTFGLGLDVAQLRVDVFVLVAGVLLVLEGGT